jgi:hypothetical protein
MLLVKFLTARTFKAHCLTYPLKVFKHQLKGVGIEVKFYYKPSPALFDCDVLCLNTEVFKRNRLNPNPPNRDRFLEQARSNAGAIVFFDTSAGRGTTWFGTLPYIDLYAKNQLLKDRERYLRPLYSNRLNSEFYHETMGIIDPGKTDRRSVLQPNQLDKLVISWNMGLGDLHANITWMRRLRTLLEWGNYHYRTTPAHVSRDIDVSYRVSDGYELPTLVFQRRETRRQLAKTAADHSYQIVYQGKLPYRDYRAEMQRTAIIPSPFGLGEVCFRDFECFLAGAALFKPDMSHLETWPDYYQPESTYIPYAWDFSDFEDKLLDLLETPEKRQRIARASQERYLHSLSPAGGEAFVEHLIGLLQKATNNAHR